MILAGSFLTAPSAAVAEGATTPTGATNAIIWSTTLGCFMRWTGTAWTAAAVNDVKMSGLSAITYGGIADDDYWPFGDKSDTTMASTGTTKQSSTAVLRDKMGAPDRALMPAGAITQTLKDRVGIANIATLTTQRPYLMSVYLEAGQVVTSITFVSGTTAGAGMTHTIAGLFDASRNLLRQSNDDTTTTWAINTSRTFTLSSTYTITASGLYYIGLCVTATTVPSLVGATTLASINGIAPIKAGLSSSTTITTTMPSTAGALTAGTVLPYAYVS